MCRWRMDASDSAGEESAMLASRYDEYNYRMHDRHTFGLRIQCALASRLSFLLAAMAGFNTIFTCAA